MAVLRIQGFSGVVPVTGDRALPDSAATISRNTWLYGNELRGLRPPTLVVNNSVATRKVFRIPDRDPGDSPSDVMASSTWKEFDHPDTDIVRGQLLEDQYERYYFCSPSTGPVFNTYARLSDGLDDYKLGVPGPNTVIDSAGNNAAKPIITNIEAYNVSENVYEIEFKIAATAGAATAYTNPGGKGDRTAIITMSGTTQFSSAMSGLINGVTTSGPTITNLADANKTIVFDFVTDKKIDEITWYQKGSRGYGDWEFQRSTDGTTWVKLGTAVMGGAPKVSYSVANTAVYRYYRLFQKDPTDSLNVTRAYVYTWVNEFGEESTPSLPATGAGDSMGVWTITNITDPPPNPQIDYPNYSHKYLYRTVSGASGQTTYYRVTEGKYESGTAIPQGGKIALGETVVIDNSANLTDAEIVNNLTLESTSWSLPPDNLQGFIAMPNGFLIGFHGSHVYMSEAYHWHAWPEEYKQATETPIVGLGILGQTCVVCTEGYPSTITGSKPAICSFTKATAHEPCLARGSIVSTTSGVLYASQNGLVLIGPGGIQNVTAQLVTREKWLRNYTPDKIRAVKFQDGYLALRDLPSPTVNSGFFLDPTSLKVALTEMTEFDTVNNLVGDFWSGEVFLLDTGTVQRWNPPTDDLMPVVWRSKEFQYVFEENFGCYAIYWDQDRYNLSAKTYAPTVMPINQEVWFQVWANRRMIYNQKVPKNGAPIRLPSGFKADIWQFEVRARAPVYSVHVASTMKELKSV